MRQKVIRIKCICKNSNCKKEFYVTQWRINHDRGKYCSKNCLFTSEEWINTMKSVINTKFKKGMIPWNKEKKGIMPVPWNKGKHGIYSENIRIRMGEKNKGRKSWAKGKHVWQSKHHPRLGEFHTEKSKEKISETRKRRFKEGLLKPNGKGEKRPWLSERNKNPEFIKKVMSSMSGLPNNPEKKMINILDNNFPNEWKYVGNGEVIIGGKCPDFVNVNGQKSIIEVFGDYWHTQKVRCYEETEKGRIEHFAKYGYKTLIIWEHELSDTDSIIEKVRCL